MSLRQRLFRTNDARQGESCRGFFVKAGALFLAALFFVIVPKSVEAASLYLSPASGTYTVGSTFTVNTTLASTDRAVNAVSGVLAFPADKLEVASLSKSGSVFGLWIQDPTYSNSAGKVSFEGVILNPGFQGPGGRLLSVTFRVKSEGVAKVSFSAGSILANDGQGTDVTTGLSGSSFTLTNTKKEEDAQAIAVLVPAPRITSSTHPDPDAWYSASAAAFAWPVPSGVDAVRLLFDKNPDAVPTVGYAPAISSRTVKDVDDGVWYFHARFKKGDAWGSTATYRIQIDTQEPERFEIHELQKVNPTDPSRFLFDAADRGSGIVRYEVRIDGGEPVEWSGSASSTYEAPVLPTGSHTLYVRAYDRAGLSRSASAAFLVSEKRPAPSIPKDAPKEFKRPEVHRNQPLVRGFWPPFIAGIVVTFVLLALFSLFGAVRRLRLKVERAIRYGRREVSDAFHDLRKGASIRETEKRIVDALNEIDKQVK